MSSELRKKEFHKPKNVKPAKGKRGRPLKNIEEKTPEQNQVYKLRNLISRFKGSNDTLANNLTIQFESFPDLNNLNMELLSIVTWFVYSNNIRKIEDLNITNFSDENVFKYYALIDIIVIDDKKARYKTDFLRYIILLLGFKNT